MSVIRTENLTYTYSQGTPFEKTAVKDVNIEIEEGELVGIIDAWNRGDLETAREKQNFSQEVINVICHFRGNIVGGKRIMKLLGFDLGPNRVPFRNMTDEEEAQMKKELEEIGFFERANQF